MGREEEALACMHAAKRLKPLAGLLKGFYSVFIRIIRIYLVSRTSMQATHAYGASERANDGRGRHGNSKAQLAATR